MVRNNEISRCPGKPARQDRLRDSPRKELATSGDASAALSTRADSPGRWNASILLVEDNPINREVALGMLEVLGCTVDTADTGAEALALETRTR